MITILDDCLLVTGKKFPTPWTPVVFLLHITWILKKYRCENKYSPIFPKISVQKGT